MKAKLGQNFLVDRNIAELEVKYASISKKDVVLEIGPGNGILTRILAENAKQVIAVELDEKLFENLKMDLPDNVQLINDDAVKIDLDMLPKFNKIVSNLPFQISSPITFKILDYDFDLAVLIYQKEFAERLIAKPGSKNYSRLTVNVYYKAECEILRRIPKTCFYPVPKVDSAMVKIVKRKTPPFMVLSEDFFFCLTKKLFTYRRKKIGTVLNKFLKLDINDAPYADNRVGDLSPEELGELCNFLYRNRNQTKA